MTSTHASPVAPNPAAVHAAGGPNVPPRTSSNHKTSFSSTAAADAQLKNLSLDDRPSSSRRAHQTSEGASDDASASRRRTHQSPKESSSRTKHTPGHSRSATAIGSTPAGTALPREESTVINRLVTSDPQEDIAREQARQAEARPHPGGTDITPITGLGLVGSEGVEDGGRGAGRSRQDHSRSDRNRKETRFGDYILGQTLGEGEFGKVKMGWKREGGVQVAIKLIRRETLGSNPSRLPKIYREIAILRGLQHPNIVRLHEMVETERHIGIILEYASGGELFDYILNHRYLKDNAARRLFAQLVSGVGYLHKKGIVHRDLKLENLLLDRNRNIIITDFGFANTFDSNDELSEEAEYRLSDKDYVKRMGLEQVNADGHRRGDLMQTSCGSPCYAAPELVVSDSLYTGRKVDVWSCGVILYAMLAGYLPFDDDPANPEGDNINLLYKYIVSTPLTFPEYVTPHARDLLKRILVPDPRKRADLFEVARHSWLSDYHHVVGFITSSTTTTNDIANTTVTSEETYETPMLARSASVREPSKAHTAVSPVGGLHQKTGGIDQTEQERQRTQRDAKRRTVQVEYVAPQSQTQRGENSSSTVSPTVAGSTSAQGTPRTRARVDGQGPTEVASSGDGYQSTTATTTATAGRTQRATTQPIPTKSQPRAVSDAAAFGSSPPATSAARPSTGGTLSGSRLPSRGNSYGQPAAATVAPTHAQGQVSRPQGKHVISAPLPHQEQMMGEPSIGRPSIGRAPSSYSSQGQQAAQRGHKRSSTIGGISEKIFGRSGSIFGGRPSQDQTSKQDRRYPPVSMQAPIPNDNTNYEPRKSTESSRLSFGFSRKNNDIPKPERTSRRFSLISGFKGFGGGHKESLPPSTAQSIDDRRTHSRGQSSSKAGMAFGRGQSRSPSQSTNGSNIPVLYDGNLEGRRRESPAQHMRDVRGLGPSSAPAGQTSFAGQVRPGVQYSHGGAYYHTNDSESSQPVVPLNRTESNRPAYPPGFTGYDDPNPGRKGVLQKPRKFADEYDQRPGHSGSSGSARRVMDIFRRIGKQRGKEDR